MNAESWIVDVDTRNFERVVIAGSLERPVVVDFWAAWCEPCKELGPLLEERARDAAGGFLLAKVDIDRHPQLAQAFRVQGIPAVLVVSGGKLVDGFEGALPPDALDEFLARHVGPGATPEDELVARVEEALTAGEAGAREQALPVLRELLESNPGHTRARYLLADLLLDANLSDEARAVFDALADADKDSPEGRALASRIDFAESAVDVTQLRAAVEAEPENAAARVELGKALVARKDYEGGLEELLEAVRLQPDGGDAGAAAKATMLETFDALGLEDPIANDYRFKLSLELFA